MAHTPGPWSIGRHSLQAGDIRRITVRGPARPRGPAERPYSDVIAEACTDWGTHDEVEANARLIAAAPEMLAALRSANHFITNGIALGFIRMPDADCPDPAHAVPEKVRAAIASATQP
jgi:hypothetical protein